MENVQAVTIFLALLVVLWFLVSMFKPLPTVNYEQMVAEIAIVDGLISAPLEERNAALMCTLLSIVENSTLTTKEAMKAYTTIVQNRVL